LLPAVNRVLDGLGELSVLSRAVRAGARVAVAGGRSTGVYVLPPLLHRYAEVAPTTQVDYSVASAEELIEGVMTGELDLAVSSRVIGLLDRREARRRGLRLTPWKAIRGGLFRLPEWSAHGGPISVFAAPYSDVAQLERMLADEFPVLKDRQWRVTPLPSTDAVRSALVNGLGMALITEDAVRREIATGAVVEEPRTHSLRPEWAYLLHRDARNLSAEARALVAFIARHRHEGGCLKHADRTTV
jgi:DNA-binding transcriptional LysR family regulator